MVCVKNFDQKIKLRTDCMYSSTCVYIHHVLFFLKFVFEKYFGHIRRNKILLGPCQLKLELMNIFFSSYVNIYDKKKNQLYIMQNQHYFLFLMLWGVFLSQNMYAMTVSFSRQLIIAECLSKLKNISSSLYMY